MFYSCCGDCGKRWLIGDARTCICPEEDTWVGLTDDEIEMIVENKRASHWEFVRQVEAILKEKNA